MTPRELFARLDAAMIDQMIAEHREEDLYLDFKTTRTPDFSNRDDRKLLAKCISGFANSAGGLIVWGVDAREVDGVDAAQDYALIERPPIFLSRLNEFSAVATAPPVLGVEHKGMSLDGASGFAATFVPPTDGDPCMAKLGEDRYYQRVGSRFVVMEHYAIADMFGRRRRPALTLDLRRLPNNDVVVSLINEGRGPARGPYLRLTTQAPYQVSQWGIDGNGNYGLPRILASGNSPQDQRFGGDGTLLIHPQQRLEITLLNTGSVRVPVPEGRYEIGYEVAAEDQPLTAATALVDIGG
jgi:hypothetical protein